MCSVEMHARGVYVEFSMCIFVVDVDDFDAYAQLHCVFDWSLLRMSAFFDCLHCVHVCVCSP